MSLVKKSMHTFVDTTMFACLPPDVVLYVLQYFADLNTLTRLACVCHKFYSILQLMRDSDSLYAHISPVARCLNIVPHSLAAFLQSDECRWSDRKMHTIALNDLEELLDAHMKFAIKRRLYFSRPNVAAFRLFMLRLLPCSHETVLRAVLGDSVTPALRFPVFDVARDNPDGYQLRAANPTVPIMGTDIVVGLQYRLPRVARAIIPLMHPTRPCGVVIVTKHFPVAILLFNAVHMFPEMSDADVLVFVPPNYVGHGVIHFVACGQIVVYLDLNIR